MQLYSAKTQKITEIIFLYNFNTTKIRIGVFNTFDNKQQCMVVMLPKNNRIRFFALIIPYF